MTDKYLRKQYKDETGSDWFNGDGEPETKYVYWLETRLEKSDGYLEEYDETENNVKYDPFCECFACRVRRYLLGENR